MFSIHAKNNINSGTFFKFLWVALTGENSLWEQDAIIMEAQLIAHPCHRYTGKLLYKKQIIEIEKIF